MSDKREVANGYRPPPPPRLLLPELRRRIHGLLPCERLKVLRWLLWDPELTAAEWVPHVLKRLASQRGAEEYAERMSAAVAGRTATPAPESQPENPANGSVNNHGETANR